MPEPVKRKLAEKLRALRGDLSLYSVEKSTDIRRAALKRYEAGENLPEDKTLEKLANFYNVEFKLLKHLYFEDAFPYGSAERKHLLGWLRDVDLRTE